MLRILVAVSAAVVVAPPASVVQPESGVFPASARSVRIAG